MTIDWRYTVEENLGVLSVAGYLGPDAVRRFTGAIGWGARRCAGVCRRRTASAAGRCRSAGIRRSGRRRRDGTWDRKRGTSAR
jgi:hypothetical protein